MKRLICVITLMSALIFGIHAQQEVSRISDLVYDHKDGLAFVSDFIKPEKQNGAVHGLPYNKADDVEIIKCCEKYLLKSRQD
jgi:hypothetical protein